ncbi:helix-turn-helix domain-containing protein [Streptomyces sp. NPDC054933]
MATRDLNRLAERVKQRRLELSLGRLKAAQSVGMSKDTWLRVERGQPVREDAYPKIARALRWAVGSCIDILEGREPILVEPSESEPGAVFASVPPEGLGDEIRLAAQDALIAVTDLSAPEIRKVNQRLLEELRRRRVIGSDGHGEI